MRISRVRIIPPQGYWVTNNQALINPLCIAGQAAEPLEPLLSGLAYDRDSGCNQPMTLVADNTFTSSLGRIKFSHIQLW